MAALVGGVLLVVLEVIDFALFGGQVDSVSAATSAFLILYTAYLVSIVLIFLGLLGLYAHQAEQVGTLGLIAFLVAFIGMLMMYGLQWSTLVFGVWLADVAPEIFDLEPTGVAASMFFITLVLFALGWLLFGLVSLQAKVLQRGASILLMVGSVAVLVGFMFEIPVSTIVFDAALVWMGYALWSGTGESASIAQETV
jgi:hypothetical protein